MIPTINLPQKLLCHTLVPEPLSTINRYSKTESPAPLQPDKGAIPAAVQKTLLGGCLVL